MQQIHTLNNLEINRHPMGYYSAQFFGNEVGDVLSPGGVKNPGTKHIWRHHLKNAIHSCKTASYGQINMFNFLNYDVTCAWYLSFWLPPVKKRPLIHFQKIDHYSTSASDNLSKIIYSVHMDSFIYYVIIFNRVGSEIFLIPHVENDYVIYGQSLFIMRLNVTLKALMNKLLTNIYLLSNFPTHNLWERSDIVWTVCMQTSNWRPSVW